MTVETIKCPHCGKTIEISQAISQDIEFRVRQQYEQQEESRIKEAIEVGVSKKEKELRANFSEEKKAIEEKIKQEVSEKQAIEITDLKNQLEEKTVRLRESKQLGLNLIKKQRELQEKEDQIDSTIEQKEVELKAKFLEDKKIVEEKARKEALEKQAIEVADLRTQLDERNKKLKDAEQFDLELRKKQRQIEEKEHELDKKLEQKENELKEKFSEEKKFIESAVKKEIQEQQSMEINDLRNQIVEKSKRLEKAELLELDFRKKQRELEEKEKAFELEFSRQLDAKRQEISEKVASEIEGNHRLKDAEKEKQLSDMRRQIEDLKRKAEQASQKNQGEVLEIELEEALKIEFPFDIIEPVASGIKGADVLQTVKTQSGKECGKILWETKHTKNWNDSWLQKLKNDQRVAKADIAILVSETLPAGFKQFREIDGVWVVAIPWALSLSLALRTILIQVTRERSLQSGKKEKMEVVYNYLTGLEFRNRIEAIVESFTSMKNDLDSERRAMERVWAKREKQIQLVISNIAGMHGDLEGITGIHLPMVKTLELPSEEKDPPNNGGYNENQ
ncbi:MAG: DUF2130 domain-containing protein [Candidatus Omnitrophota bacterium]